MLAMNHWLKAFSLVKLFQIIAITLHNSEIKILKDYHCSWPLEIVILGHT